MPSEKGVVFARKASGLTREASLLDTIYFGVMNNALPVSLWFVLGAFAYLPGANLTISAVITGVLIILGFAAMWGILGGSMPRSGGDYVYVSRIIHPSIGMAGSFSNAGFVMLGWIWILTPWMGTTGLPILAGCMGIDPAAMDPFTRGWGLYLVVTVTNILSFLVVLLGMKIYFRIQKVFVTWSILGALIAVIIITVTPFDKFVAIWNKLAASTGSLPYNEAVTAAVEKMGGVAPTWNWRSTLGMMLPVSWCVMYGFVITFIGGEVKSPRKNIFRAQVLNAVIGLIVLIWAGLAYQRMLSWNGVHAIAQIGGGGIEGYKFPFMATYINLASMIVGFNKILGFIMAGSFIVANFLWISFSYIAWSRAGFAWAMDGLGPKWFIKISPKLGQPVWLLLVMFIAGQIMLTYYVLDPSFLAVISVNVLQLVTVFVVTTIAAFLFPFLRKTRAIWEASPYKSWKIAGAPIISISSVLSMILIALMVYAFYVNQSFASMYSLWTPIYIAVWLIGLAWYYIWRGVRKKEGIEVDLAFTEIPPE